MKRYPGTVIEATADGKTFLDGLMVAGGIMMGQLTRLTGLGTPTLQNWINRGWISRPVGKRYDKNQVARLLIINSLRSTMRLEDVDALLYYVNGELNDRGDDVIDEAQLYYYICDLVLDDDFSLKSLDNRVIEVLKDYKETFKGAKARLINALEVIAKTFVAASLLSERNDKLSDMTAEVRRLKPSAEKRDEEKVKFAKSEQ